MIAGIGKLAITPEVLFLHEFNINGITLSDIRLTTTALSSPGLLLDDSIPNIDSFSPAIANVLSHFFFVFAMWVTFRRIDRYFFTFIDFLVVYLVSMDAHMCEMYLGQGCPFDQTQLWFMDHICSESAMIFVAVVFAKCRKLEREIALQTILTLGLVFYKLFTDTQYYTGAVTFILLVYGLSVNNYRMEYLSLGIVTSGTAFILFYVEKQDRDVYYETHPLWHAFAFLSLGFYILACEWKEDGIFILKLRRLIRYEIHAYVHVHAYEGILSKNKDMKDPESLAVYGESPKSTVRQRRKDEKNEERRKGVHSALLRLLSLPR